MSPDITKQNKLAVYVSYNAKLVTNHVDQNRSSIEIRHSEHTIYIKTNNPILAYALHILNNRHEYGNPEQTMQLLRACSIGKNVNCWESFYMQVLQQQNLLIDEQKVNEHNPLYSLANKTQQHITQPVTHPKSVHARPVH
jgi:hypothetical protein